MYDNCHDLDRSHAAMKKQKDGLPQSCQVEASRSLTARRWVTKKIMSNRKENRRVQKYSTYLRMRRLQCARI